MTRPRTSPQAADLDRLNAFLQQMGVTAADVDRDVTNSIRSMHNCAYAIALWNNNLKGPPSHKRVFLSEMRSDSIQVIPLGLMGYVRPATLLLRCVLENTLRHVFYYQHEVEFDFLVKNPSEYVTIRHLMDYLQKIKPFRDTATARDLLISLYSRQYKELSLDVHAHPLGHMQHKKVLSEISLNNDALSNLSTKMLNVTRTANLTLCLFHKERFSRFPPDANSAIRRLLTPSQRRLL